MKPRKPVNYVNNEDFYNALIVYLEECNNVKEQHKKMVFKAEKEYKRSLQEYNLRVQTQKTKLSTLERPKEPILPVLILPRIPEYIGKCIWAIANKLANCTNFISYSFREDMIADGIEVCILRIQNFDPKKSKNPFAYFTQLCWFAAVQRIKKEKKQKIIKSELIKNSNIINNMTSEKQSGDDAVYQNSMLNFLLENLDKPEETPEEKEHQKKFKKTTKAHQKKLKDIDLALKEYERNGAPPVEELEDDGVLVEDEEQLEGLEEIFQESEG